MKREFLSTAILFIFLFGGFNTAAAQETLPKHDVRVQVSDGVPIMMATALVFGFTDAVFNGFSGYRAEEKDDHGGGHFSLSYRYHITDRFNAGATLGYQGFSTDYLLTKQGSPDINGKRSFTTILIMPEAEYKYVKTRNFAFYGNAAFGLAVYSYDETTSGSSSNSYNHTLASIAFQANPVGLRVGNKFAGYLEAGVGFRGFFTLGLSLEL